MRNACVPFLQVAEGYDVIDKINESFVDDAGRPYQNIRCVGGGEGGPACM